MLLTIAQLSLADPYQAQNLMSGWEVGIFGFRVAEIVQPVPRNAGVGQRQGERHQ